MFAVAEKLREVAQVFNIFVKNSPENHLRSIHEAGGFESRSFMKQVVEFSTS